MWKPNEKRIDKVMAELTPLTRQKAEELILAMGMLLLKGFGCGLIAGLLIAGVFKAAFD